MGTWPADKGIANTGVDWQGTRWTMMIWQSVPDERADRLVFMTHESFHRIQPELGLDIANNAVNGHLDGADGRFWLQMEWAALEAAIVQRDPVARREALVDALTFRAVRGRRFPEAPAREVALELTEGLAEYSGVKLAGFSPENVVAFVKNTHARQTSFVRGFAYVSGPLYGFALDATSADWRTRVSKTTDLGALLGELAEVKPLAAQKAEGRALLYGGAKLKAAEAERDRKRKAQLAAWTKELVEGPVLSIDLRLAPEGSFDPNKVFPMADGKTVFKGKTLIGPWGRLTVDEGALLEDSTIGEAHVSLAGASSDGLRGQGWTLELAPGWQLAAGKRKGDRVLQAR